MRSRLLCLLVLFFSLVGSYHALAQEAAIKRSTVIENYKGKPFFIHFVKTGETLNAIAKVYSVNEADIIAENPGIEKGIKADMVLRIPKKSFTENFANPTTEKETKPAQIKPAEDAGFTLYTVKKQETLYGISKQYNVTVDDILNSNPGIEVLKEGMEIKIPKVKGVAKPAVNNAVNEKAKPETNPDEVVVKTGETLYSISKAHNITVDELIEMNPQLTGGLKAGMVLKLKKTIDKIDKPEVKPTVTKEKAALPVVIDQPTTSAVIPSVTRNCYSEQNIKTTYNIALLLPFALEDATAVLEASAESDPSTFENFNYIQFYAGFMLAADSLGKYGLNAKIEVFDAEKLNDTLAIRQTLRKPGMDKMDLLVGPVYASSFAIAARFAQRHKIGIVNPLSRRESIVEGNPYVIKTQVSGAGISAKLASFITKKYPGANIIAVQNDKKEFKSVADDFSARIKDGIAAHTLTGNFQTAVFSTDLMAGVTKKLKPGAKNIIILFSNNKTAVPNFVSLLNPSVKTNDILLIGMDEWDTFDLETEFLVNLNYHQITSSYIDYESEAVQQFITRFRNKYGAVPLPSRHAYLGYDIGWYFLTSLMWYGNNYVSCLPGNIGHGLQYNFDFTTENPGDGWQNRDVDIIKLLDYQMIKVE